MNLLRTAILCLRGSRSRRIRNVVNVADTDVEVACVEAGIEHYKYLLHIFYIFC